MIMLTNEERAALQKKYFPHVAWTDMGPVRRAYMAQAAQGGTGSVLEALMGLAKEEGFTGPGQRTVTGGPDVTLAAFRDKAGDRSIGMVFGDSALAHWCDIAVEPPGTDGWQRVIVRSEEGENLITLAYNRGLLRFRRAE